MNFHNIIFVFLIGLCALSCVKTTDNHERYLLEGERLYTTRPYEIRSFVGRDRVKLIPYVRNAFSVSEFVVEWDDNSKAFPFQKSSEEIDSIELIVDGLQEKLHTFNVYTRDAQGNESIKVLALVSAFGEGYRSNLVPRRIQSMVHDGTNGTINWTKADDFERGSQVKYINNENQEVIVDVDKDSDQVVLENQKLDAKVEYRSYYVPLPMNLYGQESSIDKFESDWASTELPKEMISILNSVEITPITEGINLKWHNESALNIQVSIDYTLTDNDGTTTEASQKSAFTTEINDTFDLIGLSLGEQEIVVKVSNQLGIALSKKMTVTPIPTTLLESDEIKVVVLPTDEPGSAWGGSIEKLLNKTLGDYYHTANGSYEAFPHHFTLDLGETYDLSKLRLYPRQDCCRDRNPSRVQIWGINDIEGAETTLLSNDAGWEEEAKTKGWSLLVDEAVDPSWNGSKKEEFYDVYIPKEATDSRYIRLRILSNFAQNADTALTEIQLYRF